MKKKSEKEKLNTLYKKILQQIDYFGNEQGCWLYTGTVGSWNYKNGGKEKSGYGVIGFDNKLLRVTRIIYELYYDMKIPEELMVLHICNVKLCVNPNHLYLGTAKDNYRDSVKAGTDHISGYIAIGEKNGSAKLKDSDVYFIKYAPDYIPNTKIARIMGVSKTCIRNIRKGITWTHLQDKYIIRNNGVVSSRSKLSDEELIFIFLAPEKVSNSEITKLLNKKVTTGNIRKIRKRKIRDKYELIVLPALAVA